MLNEFLFIKIEEEDSGNIWFQKDDATCHTDEATLDLLHPVFEDRIIAELISFGHLGAVICHHWTIIYGVPVKDKCYADKPETSGALKNNIREAIDEI